MMEMREYLRVKDMAPSRPFGADHQEANLAAADLIEPKAPVWVVPDDDGVVSRDLQFLQSLGREPAS